MELPKLGGRQLTKTVSIAVTPETKQRLVEMRIFEGIDTSTWIRQLIEQALIEIDLAKKKPNNN